MTNVSYSTAIAKDVEQFYPFFEKSIINLFPEYTPATYRYFIEKDYHQKWMQIVVGDGNKVLYLAKDGDSYVGYLFVNKVYGGVSIASWFAVDPKYQNQGIGTELIKIWEQDCLNHYGHSLHLWTTEHNISFYEKRGFVNGGTYKAAWFGVDMPMMYKTLREPSESNYLHEYLGKKS